MLAHFPVYGESHFMCGLAIPAGAVRAHTDDFDGCPVCVGILTSRAMLKDTVPCPDCGRKMLAARALPPVLEISRGVCSECRCYPVRQAAKDERARRVAAFGEGRC